MTLLKQWVSEGLIQQRVSDQLNLFLDLLQEWNHRINLTGLNSREEMEELLVGESILAAKTFPLAGKKVVDFGSGAGIPGLVWSIYDPSIKLTSVEIRGKKVAFQKEVVRSLGGTAEILNGRFPDVVQGRLFDVIATRAVRFSKDLWMQAKLHLAPGGSLVQFANTGAEKPDWNSLPISPRSTLLIQTS